VLIYAKGCKNISICGKGTIDGQTEHEFRQPDFVDPFIKREIENARRAGVSMKRYFKLPPKIFLVPLLECDNVTVENVTLTRSPMWTVHAQWCSNV
jgi:polygalacturonase